MPWGIDNVTGEQATKGFWRQVFSDENGNPSSSRIQMMAGWAVATAVVLWYAWPRQLDWGFLSTYLLFSGGVYGFAVKQNRDIRISEIEANKPQIIAAPIVPVTTQPLGDMNVKANTVNVAQSEGR
jgi:hypothetical protein